MKFINERELQSFYPEMVLASRESSQLLTYKGSSVSLHNGEKIVMPFSQTQEFLLKISNVNVSYPNIVVTDRGELIDSNNGYLSSELVAHNVPSFPLAFDGNNYFLDERLPDVFIESACYLVAQPNYSSFLLGELPRMEFYNELAELNIPILLHGKFNEFHKLLLERSKFQNNRLICIPETKTVRVSNLYHATPTYLHHQCSGYALQFLRGLFDDFDVGGGAANPIYFSRSNLGTFSDRRITNEEVIERILEQKGFRIVYPESISPIEQIRYFANSPIIISPFGAVWANSVFRKPGTKSLLLATKFTPEFSRIFQVFGNELFVLPIVGERYRDGVNFSSTHRFTLKKTDIEAISNFADDVDASI